MRAYVLKNGPLILLGSGLLSLFTLVTTLALTNLLPKETFGAYRYLLASLSLLAIATLPDMGQAVTRAISKKQAVNLGSVVFYKMRYGLIAAAVSLGLSAYHFLQGSTELGILFVITAVFVPLSDVFLIYVNVLHGVKRFGTAVAYDAVSRFLAMGFILAAAFLTRNIYFIVVATFLPIIIFQLWFFAKVRRERIIAEGTSDPSVLAYGTHLTLLGALAVLAANIDKFVIWHLLGAKALAVYAVALLIALEGGRVAETLSVIFLPFLAEDQKNIRTLLGFLPLLFGVLGIFAAVGAYVTPFVFPLLFPDYPEAIRLAQISFVLLALFPINSILYRYFVAEMWRKKMLALWLFKMGVFLIAAFINIPRFGLQGAVFSLVLGEIAALGFLLFFISKNIWNK